MSTISLIAVLDEVGGLGLHNQLLAYLPADLQYFRQMTMGKPVIMGKNTYNSIGKPLPGRINIVLTRTATSIPGAIVADSLEAALEHLRSSPEIMIIGGSQLFAQSIDRADRLYITRIHHHFVADVFFPHINELVWNCISKEFRPRDENNKYDMTFYIYERTKTDTH